MNSLSKQELNRYSRHILLSEIGLEGQQKLKDSSVLVVGAGGLGSPVLMYLTSAGIGKIGIADFDRVDESNLHRQIIHKSTSVGKLKSESAKDTILDLNPTISVKIFTEKLTGTNALKILSGFDLIVDGTDNFPTRYLLNDCCVFLKKPLIYGSIHKFEGQVSVFNSEFGPCYRCLFPFPPKDGLIQNCSETGVIGVLPGIAGTIQANEVIKVILNIGNPLVGRLLIFDSLKMSFDEMKFKKDPNCPVCGKHPSITEPIDYDFFCGISENKSIEISALELRKKILSEKIMLIDVREPKEAEVSRIEKSILIQLGTLESKLETLPKNEEIVFYCQAGTRSKKAAEILKNAGFQKVRYLVGGMNGFYRE